MPLRQVGCVVECIAMIVLAHGSRVGDRRHPSADIPSSTSVEITSHALRLCSPFVRKVRVLLYSAEIDSVRLFLHSTSDDVCGVEQYVARLLAINQVCLLIILDQSKPCVVLFMATVHWSCLD